MIASRGWIRSRWLLMVTPLLARPAGVPRSAEDVEARRPLTIGTLRPSYRAGSGATGGFVPSRRTFALRLHRPADQEGPRPAPPDFRESHRSSPFSLYRLSLYCASRTISTHTRHTLPSNRMESSPAASILGAIAWILYIM